jgi:hypothetical protein
LDMVDVITIPQRLEDAVSEPKHEDSKARSSAYHSLVQRVRCPVAALELLDRIRKGMGHCGQARASRGLAAALSPGGAAGQAGPYFEARGFTVFFSCPSNASAKA